MHHRHLSDSMSVDKFGRQSNSRLRTAGQRGPPGVGFNVTESGDYDIDKKRLTNVAAPLHDTDATNRVYVEKLFTSLNNAVKATTYDPLNVKLQTLQSDLGTIRKSIATLEKNFQTLKEAISQTEKKLGAQTQNGPRKEGSSRRTP